MLILIAPDPYSEHSWLKSFFSQFQVDTLFVESRKRGSQALKAGWSGSFEIYDEHSEGNSSLLNLLNIKKTQVLLSDGGAPCIGDPGHFLVGQAHRKEIPVCTRGIHSPILAALSMSGLSGNSFRFHGYPPKGKEERKSFARNLDGSEPQVLIEPPYRSLYLIEDLIAEMNSKSWLSFSCNIGTDQEQTFAGTQDDWKSHPSKLEAKPLGVAVFQRDFLTGKKKKS